MRPSKSFHALGTLALLACLAASASADPPSSDFDDGTLRGWSKLAPFNGNLTSPSSGGSPGGYLRVEDTMAGGGGLYVVAPAAFTGDLSGYTRMRWDEWLEDCQPSLATYPLLVGSDGTTFVPLDRAPHVVGVWHERTVPFVTDQWVRVSGTASFDDVLHTVAQLQFNMDVNTMCRFEAGLDDVRFESGALPDSALSTVSCLAICPLGDLPLEVDVRDALGAAIAGVPVTVSFAACDSVVLCRPGGGEAYRFEPGRLTIALDTDAGGHASLGIRGGGLSSLPLAEVRAGGVLLARRPVASTDLTGDLKVDPDDMMELMSRVGSSDPAADLDCNGMVNAMDAGILANHMAGHDTPCDPAAYPLVVSIVGSGAVDAVPTPGPYAHGSTVTLTPLADPGWYFHGWSGQVSGLGMPGVVVMDTDKAVTATFGDHPLADRLMSQLPSWIHMVGMRAGAVVMPTPGYVTVRDASGGPIPGATVHLDFSDCPDLLPAAYQPSPGLTTDCGGKRVSAITDAGGVVTFAVVGAAPGHGPARGEWTCAQITVDPGGLYLGDVHVSAWDLDGRDGVGGNDLNLWLCDFFWATYAQRSDFNHDGTVSALDLSHWLLHWLQNTSRESGVRCDGRSPALPVTIPDDGALRLAWDDCRGGGGTGVRAIPCTSNSGTVTLQASMVVPTEPPLERITSFDAVIDIMVPPGRTLPPWWRFGTGSCRPTSLNVITVPLTSSCPPLDSDAANGFRATYPYGTDNVERIEVLGVRPAATTTLIPGEEYALFTMRIDLQKTVGIGACAGCADSVLLVLQSLELHQAPPCAVPGVTDSTIRLARTTTDCDAYAQGSIVVGIEEQPEVRELQARLVGGNPFRGAVRVAFRAPAAVPVMVELIDPAGRRVERQVLDAAGPVEREVALGRGRALPPGLYLVRVRAGSSTTRFKVIVLR